MLLTSTGGFLSYPFRSARGIPRCVLSSFTSSDFALRLQTHPTATRNTPNVALATLVAAMTMTARLTTASSLSFKLSSSEGPGVPSTDGDVILTSSGNSVVVECLFLRLYGFQSLVVTVSGGS